MNDINIDVQSEVESYIVELEQNFESNNPLHLELLIYLFYANYKFLRNDSRNLERLLRLSEHIIHTHLGDGNVPEECCNGPVPCGFASPPPKQPLSLFAQVPVATRNVIMRQERRFR